MKKIVTRASRLLNAAAGWGVVLIMALVIMNVLLRTILKYPILGTYEYVGFLTSAVIGLSLAHCALQGAHIDISLFIEKCKPKAQAVIKSLTSTVTLVFLSLTSYHLFLHGQRLRLNGEVSLTTEIPYYPFVYLVAVGLAVFCLVIVTQLINYLQEVRSK